MNILNKTENWSGKDSFNMVSAFAVQDMKRDAPYKIVACAVGEDADSETGEIRRTGCIKTESGDLYSTVSAVVVQQLEALIELLDQAPVEVKVSARMNKAGKREYLVLQLC